MIDQVLKMITIFESFLVSRQPSRLMKLLLIGLILLILLIPSIAAILYSPIDPDSGYYLSIISRIEDNYIPYNEVNLGYPLAVRHLSRENGRSSYNFRSLLRLAFNNIFGFSDKPLKLTVALGFLLTTSSILFGIIVLVRFINGNILVPGYTSLILSIWFLGGLIITILGVVGIYVGKVFERVKDRPVYIISEMINF